uniref:ARAD1C36498p n=1 Tax=Blastobotrys adeninivorans TaxID=409370 RepID=A0A060T9A3_BLAAD
MATILPKQPFNQLADDFESIVLDPVPGLSDSSSTKSNVSSRNSSSSSSVASPGLEDDVHVFVADEDDLTHRLNGYAISTIKSRPNSGSGSARLKKQRSLGQIRAQTAAAAAANYTSSAPSASIAPPRRSSNPVPRRGASNPTTTTTTTSSSTSSSPSLRKVMSTPKLRQAQSPDLSNNNPSLPLRRKSSQKLTRRQIEQLFDAEDNEDLLLDDSCIFNVPLSPALYAKSRAASTPSSTSAVTAAAPKRKSSRRPTPLKCDTSLSAINETEPARFFATPGMESLGNDAQDLTQAFHDLPSAAINMDRRNSSPSLTSSRRSSGRLSTGSAKSSLDSPREPLSATSTRPIGLPPKSPDEERKHLREFQKLLEKTAAADMKKQERRRSEHAVRERQRADDEKTWKSHILPNFATVVSEPSTRELWWRGVPAQLREKVWRMKIGNKLLITKDDYSTALRNGRHTVEVTNLDVDKVVDTILPNLSIFKSPHGPLHDDLVNLVVAYCGYKGGGYHDGLGELAGMLLLNLSSPFDAFVALCNVLDGSLTEALFRGDEGTADNYYMSFLKVLNTKLPSLHEHFQAVHLAPHTYLEPLLTTWFTRQLSLDVVSRVWDVYIFEGDGFLLRTALGILSILEHRLYGTSEEIVHELLNTGFLEVGQEDAFMKAVRAALKA